MKDAQKFFAPFAENKLLAAFLILVNLGGVAFGAYYYSGQLSETPLYLWLFVPDSPTGVLLFAAFLFLHAFRNYQHPVLNMLASIYLVKVGLWSVLVLLLFWPSFFVLKAAFSAMLIVLHLGMILEALVVMSVWRKKLRKEHAFLVLLWFLLGDFMDYVVGTVPYPVPFIAGPYLNALAVESVIATLVLSYVLYRRKY